MKTLASLLTFLLFSYSASAKLNVVTTIPDLRAIVEAVGKDFVSVESIGKGTQDPHYIEAKPSFMVKLNRADLLISVGLDLEIGWLPSIIQGARNSKVQPGQKGYLEVGALVTPLEVPKGSISRSEGDVHPFGNPHVTLDPIRAGEIAIQIANRLAELDAVHAQEYRTNAKNMQSRLVEKTKQWQARVSKSGVSRIVTYHKTLTYFLNRFQIENVIILEPKPGIPPTSGHIMSVIEVVKNRKVPLVLVENFFDPSVTKKIQQEVPGLRVQTVPVLVDGDAGISTLDDLYERLVTAIEGKRQ